MEKFLIEGGYPLSGTVVPAGNKNAALPALAACLLTEEEVVLRNIPRIRDVEAMLDILRGVGVTVDWRDDNVVTGERITIYLAEDRNVVEGGKQERVKAVFYPKNQQEAAKPDAKPAGDGKPAGGAPCS